MKARTLSAPTAFSAASVAVLSLCAIIASSTLCAAVLPVRSMNTGLTSERTVSSIASIVSSDSVPFATARSQVARMKVFTALPTNIASAARWAARQPPAGSPATMR
jgi:hypothetical protein